MYLIGKNGSKSIGKSCVGDCFSDGTMDEIISGAFGILEGVGIRIPDRKVCDRLICSGFEQRDGRVFITRHAARAYLEKTIARRLASPETAWAGQNPYSFDGSINTYPSHYEHPVSGRILPFDTDSLILMTRFIEAYSKKEGFTPSVPGYPNDTPPSLEGLIRYKVCAGYCSRGWFAEPTSILSAKYLFRMTEIMNQKMDSLPIFVATPLTLGDESFHVALAFSSRLSSIHVSSMPVFGANTPLSVSGAYALSLAEVLGGAMIVHELTGLPVDFSPSMFPFDFQNLNIVFGSPEKLIFEWMTEEFNARLFQREMRIKSTNIHSWAKKAGVQAAAEKGMLMMAGAMRGARSFDGLGALSLDEVFSPLQLVMDIEMMNHVSRVIDGMDAGTLPPDLNDMIRQGADRGFVGSELTLDHHDRFIWNTKLFERGNLQTWLAKGERDSLDKAREIVLRTMAEPMEYELDAARKKALDEIYAQALAEVGSRG